MKYPKIATENLPMTDADRNIVKRIVNSRTGCLRASKPPRAEMVEMVDPSASADDIFGGRYHEYMSEADAETGIAAYVWRMVAFQVSPDSRHHCMPCTCDFDLPGRTGSARQKEARERADRIVEAVVNSIPMDQWNGIRRWGNVLGVIGTPRYNAEGAVIYR